MAARQRVAGIGGVFFKAARPAELAAWYREHLGVPVAPWMVNYRVADLDAMLAQLRAAGI